MEDRHVVVTSRVRDAVNCTSLRRARPPVNYEPPFAVAAECELAARYGGRRYRENRPGPSSAEARSLQRSPSGGGATNLHFDHLPHSVDNLRVDNFIQ